MKVNLLERKYDKKEIKTISVSAKCSDLCFVQVYDDQHECVKEHDGYVPEIFPQGGGDYLEFTIDVDTGQIVDWHKFDRRNFQDWLNDEDDD